MKLNKTYINIRDKWWGLPLILPSILLPVLSSANTYALTSTGNVVLFYLPLAFMLSLMLFFGWAALPGIVLAIFWRRYPQTGLYETLSVTMHFIITIVLSWGGYRVFSPRRNNVSHGDAHLLFQRIFWQVFCSATLFLVIYQFAAFVGMYESKASLMGVMPFNINTLINYQALLVGNLVGVPLCYFIIRTLRNPLHLRGYYQQLKLQIDSNTTARAVAAAADLGVWMVNVHASGGARMMAAARDALAPFSKDAPLLIAVTVLTSMETSDLHDLGVTLSPAEHAERLARLTQQCGLDGVVCSAQEAVRFKQAFGAAFKLVTPGIRPAGSEAGDQRRIMTPEQALSAGVDYMVIGRPVTQSVDPAQTLKDINASLKREA